MGFFSADKIITVASTVYNMAGEEKDRPQYLQSLVIRNVLSGTKDSIAQTIGGGYVGSPASKFRTFYKWIKRPDKYDRIGLPNGTISTGDPLNPESLAPFIPHAPDQEVWIQTAYIGSADPASWAEQWIFNNRPNDINTDWVCEYFKDTNTVLIRFEDASTVSIPATGFNYAANYLYAYYILTKKDIVGPVVFGSLVHIGSDPFPDVTDWIFQSSTFAPTSVTLTTKTIITTNTLKEYSDGRPDESTSVDGTPSIVTSPASYDTGTEIYSKSIYYGGDANLTSQNQWMNRFQNASVIMIPTTSTGTPVITTEVIDGVTITTTTTLVTKIETDSILYDRSYRIDTQTTVSTSYSDMELMIYQIGSGNPTLDSLVNVVGQPEEFFPFIPLRLKGDWMDERDMDAYGQTKKAYRKITGSNIEDLVDDLKDNEDIDDIDNAYVVFGVALNVVEEASRRYIYRFFEQLQVTQIGGPFAYQVWKDKYADTTDAANVWREWKERNNFQHGGHDETSDADPEPPRYHYPELPKNEVRVHSEGPLDSLFDMRIQWAFISNGTGTGQAKPGAKTDECWIQYMGEDEFTKFIYMNSNHGDHDFTYEKIRIYWQRSHNTFSWLEIVGAKHRNYVYGGKDVDISAKVALEDAEESGFIIPLHYDLYWDMSVIDRSQMATACVFIVFNSYDVRKQKWYETGIFRIIFVIVIAIIAVVFTGGAGFGLLGAHMSLGTALGFSGMTAAIVGSVVNALAALIISTIVEKLTSSLGVIGAILGAVFMMLVGNIAATFQNTGTLAVNWGTLLRADNLIKLTEATGNGFANAMKAQAMATMQESQDYAKKAEEKTKEVQEAYLQQFGYSNVAMDLNAFINAPTIVAETSESFLTRTTLTGSDIVDMSFDMLSNYAEYSRVLPSALS